MKTSEFVDLELQIDNLLDVISQLKAENNHLRNKLASSIRDGTILREQNQKALMKLKSLLSQLKEKLT